MTHELILVAELLVLFAKVYTSSEHGGWIRVTWVDITKARLVSRQDGALPERENLSISPSVRDMFLPLIDLENIKIL